jgi:hypothetical protein
VSDNIITEVTEKGIWKWEQATYPYLNRPGKAVKNKTDFSIREIWKVKFQYICMSPSLRPKSFTSCCIINFSFILMNTFVEYSSILQRYALSTGRRGIRFHLHQHRCKKLKSCKHTLLPFKLQSKNLPTGNSS